MTSYSLIIPTYNRPYHLVRLFSYLSTEGFSAPIWVADSSPTADIRQEVSTAIENASCILDIKWLKLASELTHFHHIFSALQEVETPFVAINADDDFLIPTAIERCVRFLSENPTYSLAHGDYWRIRLQPDPTTPERFSFISYPMAVGYHSVEEESVRERVFAQAYECTLVDPLYAVYRTDQLKYSFGQMIQALSAVAPPNTWRDEGLVTLSWAAYILQFLSAIQGKSKRLPVLYCLREGHATNWSRHEYGVGRMMIQPGAWARYDALRECIANELSRVEDISLQEARSIIDEAWILLMAAMLEKDNVLAKHRSTILGGSSFHDSLRRFLRRHHLLSLARLALRTSRRMRNTLGAVGQAIRGSTASSKKGAENFEPHLETIRACVLAHASQTQQIPQPFAPTPDMPNCSVTKVH